jgi:GNAT superfamily N-acetyltransferase
VKLVVKHPKETLPQAYFDARYEVLRKPLGSPKGSEHLAKDSDAINVWAEVDGRIAAVGRAHLLEEGEDGSVVDVKAESACPAFGPLSTELASIEDDNGCPMDENLRPAIQVRAMGTLDEYRGMGLASAVLKACEDQSIAVWNARTGWLQARLTAIPFYEKNGWVCFGPEYQVPNVGPHRSMWKKFEKLN